MTPVTGCFLNMLGTPCSRAGGSMQQRGRAELAAGRRDESLTNTAHRPLPPTPPLPAFAATLVRVTGLSSGGALIGKAWQPPLD